MSRPALPGTRAHTALLAQDRREAFAMLLNEAKLLERDGTRATRTSTERIAMARRIRTAVATLRGEHIG